MSPLLTPGHNDTCHLQTWNSGFRAGKGTRAADQTSISPGVMEKLILHILTEATPLLVFRSSGF